MRHSHANWTECGGLVTQYAAYSYDANSNRTAKTVEGATDYATFDSRDRMNTQGDLDLTYNANGELTEKRDRVTGETLELDYTTLGDLKSATTPGGAQIEYLLDGAGQRVGKKVDGQLVQGLLYSPEAYGPVAELDGNNNLVARFIYGQGSNVPDYMVKGGATYRLVTDQLGSVVMVVNASTGAIAQEISYGPFGEVLTDSDPGFQPFGFAGGLYDSDSGLVHFGAREYDAELDRWTASDPVGLAGGDTNLYGYVMQDPVNSIDPSGLYGLGNLWSDVKGTVGEMDNSIASGESWDYFKNYSAGVYHTATFGLADGLIGINPDCMGRGFGFGEIVGSAIPIGGALRGLAKLGGAAKGAGRVAGDAKGFIGPGGHRNIPSDWVTRPSRGGRGQRYWDPNNPKGNYVRIEEDAINGRHVHVTSGGKQVLNDGDRHIPFDVWDNWSTFGGP